MLDGAAVLMVPSRCMRFCTLVVSLDTSCLCSRKSVPLFASFES